MSSPQSGEKPLVTPVSMLVDGVLVAAFFAFLFSLLRSHVPSNSLTDVVIWAGLTSACMSGVFWLAIQMFRVVLRGQMRRNAARRH